MQGYLDDIERATLDNDDYRRVLYTGRHLQLVLMTLQPGEEIGEEVHEGHDQFFRIEQGEGQIVIDGQSRPAQAESGIIVPAGASPRRGPPDQGRRVRRAFRRQDLGIGSGDRRALPRQAGARPLPSNPASDFK
jgi:hypothetical protein